VMICGEPGTGRSHVARAIHQAHDANAPFIGIDCSSTRDLELALFGRTTVPGLVEERLDVISSEGSLYHAFGGTLFLRALHEMPARIQRRLARILRDGEVNVSNGAIALSVSPVRLRLIGSTDSTEGDDSRVFAELRTRLTVHRVDLPPLRQRREDLPGLIRMVLAEICDTLRLQPKGITRQAMALLAALPWHGNFPEMQGLLRGLALKVPGGVIRIADVLATVRLDGTAVMFPGAVTLKEARDRFEREYVAAVLDQHHGRMAEAARVLGIQRTNLYRKLRQLAVERKPRRLTGV
jgi:DNA-binding NtrC family response regulator